METCFDVFDCLGLVRLLGRNGSEGDLRGIGRLRVGGFRKGGFGGKGEPTVCASMPPSTILPVSGSSPIHPPVFIFC